MTMKVRLLMSIALLTALLSTSCSNDIAPELEPVNSGNTLTFTITPPAGEKVEYTRALHDEQEYAINKLYLLEYEVNGEESVLTRAMAWPDNVATGNNTLNLTPVQNADASHTFSIVVPEANMGKTYSYYFIANPSSSISTISAKASTIADLKTWVANANEYEEYPGNYYTFPNGTSANPEAKGLRMSGVAECNGKNTIVAGTDLNCDVKLTRFAARLDVEYQTPNLRISEITLEGFARSAYFFPKFDEEGNSVYPMYYKDQEYSKTMTLNPDVELPEKYLKDEETKDKVELKKAFYTLERANSKESGNVVHIRYTVIDDNGKEIPGEIDVPFMTKDGRYVSTERNHLYRIVLGNGKEPVAGKLTASIIVDDWKPVDVDAPLTGDDKIKPAE